MQVAARLCKPWHHLTRRPALFFRCSCLEFRVSLPETGSACSLSRCDFHCLSFLLFLWRPARKAPRRATQALLVPLPCKRNPRRITILRAPQRLTIRKFYSHRVKPPSNAATSRKPNSAFAPSSPPTPAPDPPTPISVSSPCAAKNGTTPS